jgi:FixJ family two-component response regulator
MPRKPLISVVDDDVSVRESLPDFLSTFGFSVRSFASAREFLESASVDRTDCLVLDISMPEMTGPELQAELKRMQKEIPIVFITAHVAEATRLYVLEQGAIACLLKPFTEAELLEAVHRATDAD